MSATTVKLDADLLREIGKVKKTGQTLSAFVRESLQADLRQRKLRAAAEAYQQLLAENSGEREEMEAWEAAPLERSPKRARK